MAEPDDYDDAMIDELMMNGGGEFGEPSAAELEMEFEMEQEREFEMQQEREREMAGGPDGGPPTSEPPAPQPPAEPEPGLGGVAMEEEEEEPTPPANVKASFSLPDGEGQINLLERPASGPGKLVPPSGSLLARPLASLMHDLDRRAAFELQADANPPPPPPANPTDDPTKGGQLWVDKYAPRAFVELLSDERLNRQVLRWLKQWNPLVFGTAAPPAESKASWQGGGGSWGAAGAGAGAGGGAGGGAGPTASKRPEKPLLLIAGPPGLGKTTLAHVAAAHAGYRTIEINSSDDRTAKVLRQRIKDATEVQSVFGAMSARPEMARPVCVILDEIDGAMGGSDATSAISELVRMATGAGGKGGEADEGEGGKGGAGALQRPVICVCNELHAAVLRPLRQVAEIVEFKGALNAQLASRLRKVCQREGLRAEANTLAQLATLAQNDVRACLNTLQFVRAKSAELTDEMVTSGSIGRCKSAKNVFELWKQVFVSSGTLSSANKKCKKAGPKPGGGGGGGGAAATDDRQLQLLHALEHADAPRVMDGVVEHYLSVPFTDPQMVHTTSAADWLSQHDVLSHQQFNGHFALARYLDWSVVAVQHYCSVPYLPRPFGFPRAASEHRQRHAQRQGQLRSWQAGLAPSLFNRYTPRTLVLDLLAPLVRVLAPPLRPTAAGLLSTEERAQLMALVELMLCFGLQYTQVQADNRQYVHRLDPPLAEFLPRETDEQGEIVPSAMAPRELPNAVKQLLSFEIGREIMRRSRRDAGDAGGDAGGAGGGSGGGGGGASPAAAKAAKGAKAAPPAGKAGPKVVTQREPSERRDMFGRLVAAAPARKRKDAPAEGGGAARGGAEPETVQQVRYKYHEGVTNAVRRTVRVQDLL